MSRAGKGPSLASMRPSSPARHGSCNESKSRAALRLPEREMAERTGERTREVNQGGAGIDDSLMLASPWRLVPWMAPAAAVVCLMLIGFGVLLKPRVHFFAPAQVIEVSLLKLTPAIPGPIGAGKGNAGAILSKLPSIPPVASRAMEPPVHKVEPLHKKKVRHAHKPPPKVALAKPPVPIEPPPAAPSSSSIANVPAPAEPNAGAGEQHTGGAVAGADAGGSGGGGDGSSPASFDADYLHNPAPRYPVIALRMGIQGETLLRVLVNAEGEPEKVELAHSSGSSVLDEAAEKAVEHWRFIPARRGDTPVSSWVEVPIRFRFTRAD